jgi:hypothetical protein
MARVSKAAMPSSSYEIQTTYEVLILMVSVLYDSLDNASQRIRKEGKLIPLDLQVRVERLLTFAKPAAFPQAKSSAASKKPAKNPLIEKRPRNYGIGKIAGVTSVRTKY